MNETRKTPNQEYGPGNPQFPIGQRVKNFLKHPGTVIGVSSGAKSGYREVYEVLLDNPFTQGGNDNNQFFNFDQISKLEE